MWKNKRLIYNKQAQLPTPWIRDDSIVVFYSWRKNNISHIGKLKFDFDFNLIEENPFILGPGNDGNFDDSGVMPSCVLSHEGNYLFYTGWHLRKSVPYSQAIGVCSLKDDETAIRLFEGPILSQNKYAPTLVNSGFAYAENNKINMIYCAGTHWHKNKPCYHLRQAEAEKNFNFHDVKPILKTSQDDAISRCVIHHNTLYFSKKEPDTNYQIYSFNKKVEISHDSWDNQMKCYPYVFSVKNKTYMMYNGNNYGDSGIGLLESNE